MFGTLNLNGFGRLGGGGGGGVVFPRPFVVDNRPRGTCFYDSLGNQLRAQTAVAGSYNDKEKTYFDPTTAGGIQDMSTDGSALLKSVDGSNYQINDDSGSDPAGWTRGNNYAANFAGLSSGASTSDYALFMSGVNDATVGSPITKTTYKQAMHKLKEFIQEDFPNIQCGFVHILHRSDYDLSVDATYQLMREAQIELCAEDTWFYALPDMYDLALYADQDAHLSVAERQTNQPNRIVKAIADTFGKTVTGSIYGPQVTSGVFNGSYMDLTVAHDAGTDFATIPSLAENTVALRTSVADYKASSIERIDATTLRAWFENKGIVDATIQSAVIAHGTMKELTFDAAEVVKDNAADARPLRSGVVSLVNSDPLFDVHDLNLDLITKVGTKTYSSGAQVTQITDRMNGYWKMLGTTREPTYDDTKFGNEGALVDGDGTTFLINNTVFAKSNTGWGGIVFEVPAVTVSNKYVFTFGYSNIGTNLMSFYMTTGGALYWTQAEGGGVQLISGAQNLRGTKNILVWNFKSTSAVDMYLNGNAVLTFDPRNSLISMEQISLFGRLSTDTGNNTGLTISRAWHRNTAHGTNEADPDISTLLAAYKAKYGTQD